MSAGAVTPEPDHHAAAAERAGVVIRELAGLAELALVDGLFAGIWGPAGGQVAMPVNLLQALVHSGNYVAGAWRGSTLVAAAVAFLGSHPGPGAHDGATELHSHVAGVARSEQGTGVGLALKLHQRDWARARGVATITWTYDPLIRRNGWFNLVALGATATDYLPDFYGPMLDELNGTDETDRCLVRWGTADPFSRSASAAPGAADADVDVDAGTMLEAGPGGEPGILGREPDGRPLLCQVPPDVVALRRSDPALARRWRLALRDTMGRAMAAGYRATSMTGAGAYLLERPERSDG